MSDLTDRMRTCAAHVLREGIYIEGELPLVYRDAADLLIEAAHLIDMAPAPLGEPMEIIEPVEPVVPLTKKEDWTLTTAGTWVAAGDTLPVANPYRGLQTCPKCDSRANKTVRKMGKSLWLVCPVCEHAWTR